MGESEDSSVDGNSSDTPQISLDAIVALESLGRAVPALRSQIQKEYEENLRARIEASIKSSKKYDVLDESFFKAGFRVPIFGRVCVTRRKSTREVIEKKAFDKISSEYSEQISAVGTTKLLAYFMRRMLQDVKKAANNLLEYITEKHIENSRQMALFDVGGDEGVLRNHISNVYEAVRSGNARIEKEVKAAQGFKKYWAEVQPSDFKADIDCVNLSLGALDSQNTGYNAEQIRDAALRMLCRLGKLHESFNLSQGTPQRWRSSYDFIRPLEKMGFSVKVFYKHLLGKKEPIAAVYARREKSK